MCTRAASACAGEDGIKHLMSRGRHRFFGYRTLLVVLLWYGSFAALCSGSAISSGLFVPMLMIGACIGRLIGLATVDVFEHLGYQDIFDSASGNPWKWIDPGAFALVGAGGWAGWGWGGGVTGG